MDRCRREQGGFLQETDVEAIAADSRTRLTLLLVRCGGGRFMAPANQVLRFVRIIEEHDRLTQLVLDNAETLDNCGIASPELLTPGDYVRDISLPAAGVELQ